MPIRVALIGHSYMESAFRGKLVHLAEATDFCLITPLSYPMPYGWRELDAPFNHGVAIKGYPIHFLHLRRTSTRWVLRSRDLGFAEFQPDIIHIENEHHSWVVCQSLIYRRLFAPKAKVVVFCWDNLWPDEQLWKSKALQPLADFNRQFVDFFICGNRAGQEILIAQGVRPSQTAVLPQSGIDPDVFRPYSHEQRAACRQELGISSSDFAIGYVGRFVEEKGILDLAEAVGRLEAGLGRQPVLVLAGKGPLEERVRLRASAIGVRLVIASGGRNDKVPATMNALDTLVLPSRSTSFWKEQFGRVLIEAMACAVPVIGSDSGEIPNVIGDAGLVFHEGDVGQLSKCIRRCVENELFRRDLGTRGMDRARKNFTNLEIARRTLRIYEQVTDSSVRPCESFMMPVSHDPRCT